MGLYAVNRNDNAMTAVLPATFREIGARERFNLQEWIAKNPDCLCQDDGLQCIADTLIDCIHRELTDADFKKITATYHARCEKRRTLLRQPRRLLRICHLHLNHYQEIDTLQCNNLDKARRIHKAPLNFESRCVCAH